MAHYDNFTAVSPPGPTVHPASEALIQQYQGLLPDSLLEQWAAVGLGPYHNGLLWLIDPSQLRDVLADWLEAKANPAIPFCRDAFGDLLYWQDNDVRYLDVHRFDVRSLSGDLTLFMNQVVTNPAVRQSLFREGLFDAVRSRLRPPEEDECYAFVPALALGGSPVPESVQIMKLREHLGVLSQLFLG